MSPSQRLRQVSTHLAPAVDPSRIDGQVVLITGAAQGIGRASAELLASKGAKIVINDLDKNKASQAVQELSEAGYDALSVPGDLLDINFPDQLVKATLQQYGKINILINNAGFCFDDPVHNMSEQKFDVIMKIHNYVPFRMVKALSGHWRDPAFRDDAKAIINISSVSGLHGAVGQINYATAKAGINGMTKAIAKEWSKYNVRCNSVAYGWIDTRITRPPDENEKFVVDGQEVTSGMPTTYKKWRDTSDILIGRPGTIQEAAGVMLFLASPLSSYVTGACIECTGGRYL